MSKSLQDALKASMEAEETVVEETIEAVLDQNKEVETGGMTPTELRDELQSTDNVAEVLETIAEDATIVQEGPAADGMVETEENKDTAPAEGAVTTISVEALAYSLKNVLQSHGVKISTASMEAAADPAAEIARVAGIAAGDLRKKMVVTLENATEEMRSEISRYSAAINKTKTALDQAIRKVSQSAKAINGESIVLNHRDINTFLHRSDEPVLDLKDALSPDIKAMEALKKIIVSVGTRYNQLLVTKDVIDEKSVEKFIHDLSLLNVDSEFDGIDGTALLSNGQLVRHYADGHSYLEIDYGKQAQDAKGVQKWATSIGTVAGGVAGAALLLTPLGIVIAASVGAIGGAIVKNHGNGKNTESANKAEDLIAFLKDAQAMCDMIKGVSDSMAAAQSADTRARKYGVGLANAIKNDNKMQLFLANAGASLLGAVVAAKSGQRNNIGANRMSGAREDAIMAINDQLDINYEAYHSVGFVLIEHVFNCVDNALKIAQSVIKQVEEKK